MQTIEFVTKSTMRVNGVGRPVRVYFVHRDGAMAPSYWYFKYGRRKHFVTPFEQRVRGWERPSNMQIMSWTMARIYRPSVASLIRSDNPILALIDKRDAWKGAHYVVP